MTIKIAEIDNEIKAKIIADREKAKKEREEQNKKNDSVPKSDN